ncbi:MAG: GH92 family glycosyl hydrolase [Sedimentisphaerales bacterium]|nr:GH92 family glycosyl hydrolase [Sedimentisphaerales bacterium]
MQANKQKLFTFIGFSQNLRSLLTICGIMLLTGISYAQNSTDLSELVNPFIGTVRGSGSTYPGAQVPLGMLSFSPHTPERNHGSGYDYTCDEIRGFGLVHISGVGCEAVCELPFMPVTGELTKSPALDKNAYSSKYRHDNEQASPGYYSVTLDNYAVNTELTATTRCGMAKFTYQNQSPAHIIFDPGASANGMRDGLIEIDAKNRSVSGWVNGGGFCHQKKCDYIIYYTVVFDTDFSEVGCWQGESKNNRQSSVKGNDIAAYFSFPAGTKTVTMKTAISFVSLANARENLATEMPHWDFTKIRSEARNQWNKTLSRIQIEGGTLDDRTIFYTALYHTLMLPNIFDDVNGEYIGMDNKTYKVKTGHHAYATFSGWDTYRTQAQLWGLLYPEIASDFCQTLLDTSKQTQFNGGGGLPLWSMFNDETLIMAGYPAALFIANAYAFGARDFDVKALTEIMIDSGKENRYWGRNLNYTWQYLTEYKQHGFYPDDCGIHCSISQTVEYSLADFAIAQMAKIAGDDENYKYFLDRSQNFFNLLHPTEKYLWPKYADGTWKNNFNPYSSDSCQEGTSTHYTWGAAHNLTRLINEIGGESIALERLDKLMAQIAFGYDYGNPHYLAGNEPCFGIVPVYNWAGAPWKAQQQMRNVIYASFSNTPKGIPGDDDSGAMSAWYIFAALGLYPEVPGIGGFAITGPLFEKATLSLPNDRKLVITAKNASTETPYINSMTINGEKLEQSWITMEQLTQKKITTLHFDMASEPNKEWAKGYRPPSHN